MSLSQDSRATEEHWVSGNSRPLAPAGAEIPVKGQWEGGTGDVAWPSTPWTALGSVTGQSRFTRTARRKVHRKRGRRQHHPTWIFGRSLWLKSEEEM